MHHQQSKQTSKKKYRTVIDSQLNDNLIYTVIIQVINTFSSKSGVKPAPVYILGGNWCSHSWLFPGRDGEGKDFCEIAMMMRRELNSNKGQSPWACLRISCVAVSRIRCDIFGLWIVRNSKNRESLNLLLLRMACSSYPAPLFQSNPHVFLFIWIVFLWAT